MWKRGFMLCNPSRLLCEKDSHDASINSLVSITFCSIQQIFNSHPGHGIWKWKTHLSTCVGKTQFFPTVCFFPVNLFDYSHKFWSPNCEPSSLLWSQLGVLWFNSILTLFRVSGTLYWEQRSKTSIKTRDAPSVLII